MVAVLVACLQEIYGRFVLLLSVAGSGTFVIRASTFLRVWVVGLQPRDAVFGHSYKGQMVFSRQRLSSLVRWVLNLSIQI